MHDWHISHNTYLQLWYHSFYPNVFPTCLRFHVHSSSSGTSMAFFLHLEKTHHHPHLSPTFRHFSFRCQWQLMCPQEWQMIIGLKSLKKIKVHISYKSFSTEHTEHHIITSTHSQIIIFLTSAWLRFSSMHACLWCMCNFSAVPPPHITGKSLLFQLGYFL